MSPQRPRRPPPTLFDSEEEEDSAHRRIQRLRAFHHGATQFVAALQAFLRSCTSGGRSRVWRLVTGACAWPWRPLSKCLRAPLQLTCIPPSTTAVLRLLHPLRRRRLGAPPG